MVPFLGCYLPIEVCLKGYLGVHQTGFFSHNLYIHVMCLYVSDFCVLQCNAISRFYHISSLKNLDLLLTGHRSLRFVVRQSLRLHVRPLGFSESGGLVKFLRHLGGRK